MDDKQNLNGNVTTLNFPSRLGGGSVALRFITTDELLSTTRAYGNEPMRVTVELTKRCVAEIDGQKVDQASPDFEKWWAGLGYKKTQLLIAAYGAMNNVTEEDLRSFLDSGGLTLPRSQS